MGYYLSYTKQKLQCNNQQILFFLFKALFCIFPMELQVFISCSHVDFAVSRLTKYSCRCLYIWYL